MSDADVFASWVPAADRAEQQTPAEPEPDDMTTLPEVPALGAADEADVLEQARSLPLDEDDYRGATSAEQFS
jgi:hypothetical protein